MERSEKHPTNRRDRRRERKLERAQFMRTHRRTATRPLVRNGRYFCPLCSRPVRIVLHPEHPELGRVECGPCAWASEYGAAVPKETTEPKE